MPGYATGYADSLQPTGETQPYEFQTNMIYVLRNRFNSSREHILNRFNGTYSNSHSSAAHA